MSGILSIPIKWFRALPKLQSRSHGPAGSWVKKIMAGPLSCYDNGPAINTNFFFTDISDEGDYNRLTEPLILKITWSSILTITFACFEPPVSAAPPFFPGATLRDVVKIAVWSSVYPGTSAPVIFRITALRWSVHLLIPFPIRFPEKFLSYYNAQEPDFMCKQEFCLFKTRPWKALKTHYLVFIKIHWRKFTSIYHPKVSFTINGLKKDFSYNLHIRTALSFLRPTFLRRQ